jgi:hypothetical protein
MVRSLIREFLLQEEVFGAQAFVYHGSRTAPDVLIPALLNDKFNPGGSFGDLYGKGLYTVYDLEGTPTGMGGYGKYIYKLKINLYGFISFDSAVTKLIYKRDLEPWQQAQELGLDSSIVEMLKESKQDRDDQFTSDEALSVTDSLSGKVKGIIYTGRKDGRCALAYDASVAVPVAWKRYGNESWTSVDKELIKPALRRTSTGEWEEDRYSADILVKLKKIGKLPIEKRIWKGGCNLEGFQVTSLPAGFKVRGCLNLSFTQITSLPAGLEVDGYLDLRGTEIQSLPNDIRVGAWIDLSQTEIKSLPENLKVRGSLNLYKSPISSLPSGLKVGTWLKLSKTQITSLPDDIKVGSLLLYNSDVTSLPDNLEIGDLNIRRTQIKSLPSGLNVKDDLSIGETQIASLPDDLQVGGYIYGFEGDISSVREDLRKKLKD